MHEVGIKETVGTEWFCGSQTQSSPCTGGPFSSVWKQGPGHRQRLWSQPSESFQHPHGSHPLHHYHPGRSCCPLSPGACRVPFLFSLLLSLAFQPVMNRPARTSLSKHGRVPSVLCVSVSVANPQWSYEALPKVLRSWHAPCLLPSCPPPLIQLPELSLLVQTHLMCLGIADPPAAVQEPPPTCRQLQRMQTPSFASLKV